MPKATTPSASRQTRRHNPLEDDITATGILKNKPSKRRSHGGDNEEENFVDDRASRTILRIGRELAEEENAGKVISKPTVDTFGYDSRFDDEAEDENKVYDDDETWGDDDEVVEEIEVDPNDLDMYKKFMPDEEDDLLKHGWDRQPSGEEQGDSINLADLILEKIAAHEAAQARRENNLGPPDDEYELPPQGHRGLHQVSQDLQSRQGPKANHFRVGQILSRYKSGPLPKPFKILPTIPHWEDIIEVTKPDSWSPNACYQATRIFVSSKPHVVQRFLEMVILDRVREDIYETKKLNVHLFNSLKKALYKPAAFFKGFLFPPRRKRNLHAARSSYHLGCAG
ncbi:snoRNA-binding rRNA-processing protein [Fusarium solani]